jgi:hypothetical protein
MLPNKREICQAIYNNRINNAISQLHLLKGGSPSASPSANLNARLLALKMPSPPRNSITNRRPSNNEIRLVNKFKEKLHTFQTSQIMSERHGLLPMLKQMQPMVEKIKKRYPGWNF